MQSGDSTKFVGINLTQGFNEILLQQSEQKKLENKNQEYINEYLINLHKTILENNESREKLKVKLLRSNSNAPTRHTEGSAGLDLYAVQSLIIPPKSSGLVSTGIAIECPLGCYAKIAGKSKLAGVYNIMTFNGTIDPDFRGEITAMMYNYSEENFCVEAGDQVAQTIIERYSHCAVEIVEELSKTVRGTSAGMLFEVKNDKGKTICVGVESNNNEEAVDNESYSKINITTDLKAISARDVNDFF